MSYRTKLTNSSLSSSTSYRKTVLPNGIRIISEEITSVKSVSFGVWINTGSRNETSKNNGISHFIEHMMFKGTENRTYRQIANSIESIGGVLNAFTTKEHTCYYVKVLDEFSDRAVDVLSDMIQHSTFPKKEIEKEKTVVLEEIKQTEDDPDDLVHEYFEQYLFRDHPLGMQIIGTAENVSSFTRDELAHYVASYYTPENIVVSAAGNIQHDHLVMLVQKYFSMTSHTRSVVRREFSTIPKTKKVYKEFAKPIQQAHICTGTTTFTIHDKLRYPSLLMNSLLGDGMSSRLFQKVRERYGLAYSVYSFMSLMNDTGAFGVYIGTDKNSVKKALDVTYNELERLKTKAISKSELNRVKAQLKGSMLLSLESTSNRMMRLAGGELYFGEYTSLESIVRDIDAVTPDDILDVARRLCAVDGFVTVILSPNGNEFSTN